MIYSLAPSGRIDTGKTWPVYTVRLRVVGRRACIMAWVQANACARQDPGSKRTHRHGQDLAGIYSYALLGVVLAYTCSAVYMYMCSLGPSERMCAARSKVRLGACFLGNHDVHGYNDVKPLNLYCPAECSAHIINGHVTHSYNNQSRRNSVYTSEHTTIITVNIVINNVVLVKQQ